MKTLNYFFFICLFLAACSKDNPEPVPEQESDIDYLELISGLIEAQNMPRPADSYNYPIYPGRKNWALLPNQELREEVIQVPVDIAKSMSTQALIQALWEYPFAGFMFGLDDYDRYQSAFNSRISSRNAYVELTRRTDAGSELLYRLERVNPLASSFPQYVLNLLTSQTVFVTKLNDGEKRKVIEIAIENESLRQAVFGTSYMDKVITALLTGRIMFAAGYAPFVEAVNGSELEPFLYYKNYCYFYERFGYKISQDIINFALQYLNE